MSPNAIRFIVPNWPAPANVRALTTTRTGGVSRAPFDALNLGMQVGDAAAAVQRNRARLRRALELPGEPRWLTQVHGTSVIDAAQVGTPVEADGSATDRPGVICTVLTADCLPVFLCDRCGTRVALLHAGWRGLGGGVIEAGVAALGRPPQELLAWLGPAIGSQAYEVGDEVRASFVQRSSEAASAFHPNGRGRWLADLYTLARQRLAAVGVTAVSGGQFCTYRDRERFFSFRRDGQCGRMASLIWLSPHV